MTFKTTLASIGLMAFMGALPACETAPTATRAPGGAAVIEEAATRSDLTYVLGSGDQLRVTVFGQEELSGEFEIDGSGEIALPLIGEVPALGTSTRDLENAIAKKLSDGGYILDPRVNIEVTNYRPFYILGEVNRPGEYPYTSGLTVVNAVASAGGFTFRAKKQVVYIRTFEGDQEFSYALDATLEVLPGDTIRIGERLF